MTKTNNIMMKKAYDLLEAFAEFAMSDLFCLENYDYNNNKYYNDFGFEHSTQ